MPAPFPRRRGIDDDVTHLYALERGRSTARGLGYSTLAPGDGWIGITDPTGTEVARAGEQGLWVPDGTGGWILVQVDAQRRADAAEQAAAADATAKADAARDAAIATAAADAVAKADAARTAAISTAAADATTKAETARQAAIATAAADATSKANAAREAAITHSNNADAGQDLMIQSVTQQAQSIANWLATYFGYPGPPN